MPQGTHREVKTRYRHRETEPGTYTLLGCMSEVLWGSLGKVLLVNSNQNEQDFGKFYGFLSGKSGRLLITGLWGSHIRNLPLLVTLWAAVQGMCLHGG